MQIKKDELRKQILITAEREFLKRGFKNASMRTIAAKSHTTLGNLYNYFENKEAILSEVIGDTPEKILDLVINHENVEALGITVEDLENNLSGVVETYTDAVFPLDVLLSNSVLILLEGCEGTKYEQYRNTLIQLFQAHIASHLNVAPDNFLARSIVHGFLSSLIFIGKNKKSMEDGKRDFVSYIKMMILGMPIKKDQ